MASGFIENHPVLSIPSPHQIDHPGLAIFSSSSIVPSLRFYSFTFRVFFLSAVMLIFITRPLMRFVREHGKNSPAVFQEQTTKKKGRSFQFDEEECHFMLLVLDSIFYNYD